MKEFDYRRWTQASWEPEIVDYIAKISEYKGRQDLYQAQGAEILSKLTDLAIIQSTSSSNRIEGIITTDQRLRDLVMKKTSPKNRDEEEIMGYQDVLSTIHESYQDIPLTPPVILQLHRDLYKYSQKSIGGKFKNTQNYISKRGADGKIRVRFMPLEPYKTPPAIEAICKNYREALAQGSLNPLILIPIFIHDFLCIHPFNDGNGRMSRLLTTLLLYQSGYEAGKYISLEEKIDQTKSSYYPVLAESGLGWHENREDPSPFIKYLLGTILSAYRDFESRLGIFGQKSPALDQVRRAAGLKLGKFSKRDIMDLLPHLSQSSVEKSLGLLVEEGYLKRAGRGRGTYYTLTGL